jgi:P-type Cu2+ transporter
MSIHTYHVPDIRCNGCASAITNALAHTALKAYTYQVDALKKTLVIDVRDALDDALIDELVAAALHDAGFSGSKQRSRFSYAMQGTIGLSLGFILLLLPLVLPAMPFLLTAALSIASAAATLTLGWPFYRRAYYGLRQGVLTMDTLFSISTLVIISVSLGALLAPALPMMLEAGLLIFGFRHLGIAIADYFKANLLRVPRFQEDAPSEVCLPDKQKKKLKSVKSGDALCLAEGDMLPVDGVFTAGAGMVSDVYQTGSYHLKPLVLHQSYPAGTKLVSVSADLAFTAEKKARDSFLAQEDRKILDLKLKRALAQVGQQGVTYWLQFFVPAVVAIALLSGLAIGLYFSSVILAIQCAVSVLVAACPCTLGLIVPLVRHVGIKKAEKAGVIVRDPEQFDTLNKIDCVMFDLNGTLTCGAPEVIYPEANQALIQLMAQLESREDHWVARAIKQAAKSPLIAPLDYTDYIATQHGLRVTHEGHHYVLGDRFMMEAAGINQGLDVALGLGETAIYLAKDGVLEGHVMLQDKIRDGAHQVIRELQAAGKKVCLLTGASHATAARYATAFGIPDDQVFSGCSIDDKNAAVLKLKATHEVAVIGDGVNDAPAIADSFGVVVAHEAGHVGTQQGASAVLQSPSLLPLLDLFKIARDTTANINQNIGFSFLYTALAVLAPTVLVFGLGVVLSPAVGAGLMIVQMLLIFANVYRFDSTAVAPVESKPVVSSPEVVSGTDDTCCKNSVNLMSRSVGFACEVEGEENTSYYNFTMP